MKTLDKAHIVAEIQRTAADNGGSPLGIERFLAETGIKRGDWLGKHWARWGDALIEAGFDPNTLQGPRSEDELLDCLARLAGEIGRFPVDSEIKIRAKSDPGFPWHNTFDRFGNRLALAQRLREYAIARDNEGVVASCEAYIARSKAKANRTSDNGRADDEPELGYVYLLKSGRYFKIGRTNAVGRRERELAIQLPERAKVVHYIKTDDPAGIEDYWHRRFADRRQNGEWFALTPSDVAAFRRRKFM